MAHLVLCGGQFALAGQRGSEQPSHLAPAYWGYAAGLYCGFSPRHQSAFSARLGSPAKSVKKRASTRTTGRGNMNEDKERP